MSKNEEIKSEGINRRELLVGVGALAVAASAGAAFAADKGGHDKHAADKHAAMAGKKDEGLVETSLDCLKKGEACIKHCLDTFAAGETMMAECAAKAQEMVVVCQGLSYLASYNSKHLKKYVAACIDVCTDCEAACRKHAEHAAPCKECADACLKCIEQCRKVG
jgi:Cys-rich four helix bundle protein (predicted Tat secretion target)